MLLIQVGARLSSQKWVRPDQYVRVMACEGGYDVQTPSYKV